MNRLLLLSAKVLNRLFGRYKSKKDYYPAWQYLYGISLQGLGRQQGSNTADSGEAKILDKIFASPQPSFTIIDVGANKGQYASLVLEHFKVDKQLSIHLFETFPSNIKILDQSLALSKRKNIDCHINETALTNTEGELNFYSDNVGSDLGSVFDLRVSVRPFDASQTIKVHTTTLDNYVKEKGIQNIDLLKMDVEGSEFNVLRGASAILGKSGIKNIQFEFGTGNISSRVFFLDFWDLLSPKYRIYHILQDGLVEIKNYDTALEVFKTTNYFATLK